MTMISEASTTRVATLLRISTLASGAALAVMSLVSFFASIALLSPSAVIVAFYTVYVSLSLRSHSLESLTHISHPSIHLLFTVWLLG